MNRLIVLENGNKYKEGDYIKLNNSDVIIEYITVDGYLYNKKSLDDKQVVVSDGEARTNYYANWDYLEFVKCDVTIDNGECNET